MVTPVNAGNREAGQDLVEYALTVLLFLALTTFILDGGRILWNYVTLTEATRSGARYATTHKDSTATDVRGKVVERSWGVDPTSLSVVKSCPLGCYLGETVWVTTTYQVKPLTNLVWPGMTFRLYAESAMEIQN